MQGNEAVVRGAVEAGINFAASYPGSPSSQVLGMLGKIARERNFYAEWSTMRYVRWKHVLAYHLQMHGRYVLLSRTVCYV